MALGVAVTTEGESNANTGEFMRLIGIARFASRCSIIRLAAGVGVLLVGTLLLGAPPLSAAAVSEVVAEGCQTVNPSLVISTSGVKIGDEFTTEASAKAIRDIYRLGLFSDVQVRSEELPGGLKVIFVVAEKPILKTYEITGNRKIGKKDIEEKVSLKEGEPVDVQTVEEAKQKILDLYREKGYLNATVSDSLSIRQNQATLKLAIGEGKKVRIRAVNIEGNQAVSDRRITTSMKLKAKRWFRSGDFKEELYREDTDRILKLYRDIGYLDARIAQDTIIFDPGREWMTINITIDEQSQYRTGTVVFRGNSVISTPRLSSVIRLKEGSVFSQSSHDKSLEALYNAYTEEGYIYCQIDPDRERRGDTLDLTFRIQEGSPAHVRLVKIAGNTRTREKVIRRELSIKPGSIFRRSAVMRSQRDVFNLGFFSDVKLDYERINEAGDVDLVFTVEEKPTGSFQVGTTYNSVDRFTGYIELSQPNLFGRGQLANIKWNFGATTQNIELGFTEPWLFDRPISAGADIFHLIRERDYYEERRSGGSIRIGRPFPWLDYTKLYWGYTLEDVDFRVTETDTTKVPYSIRSQQGVRRTSSTRLTLVRDSRDRFLAATRGSRITLSPEWAGGGLGGSVDFQKYIVEASTYHRLYWKFVLMLRGRFGIIDGYTTPSTVPSYERFFLGGTGSDGVRGYPDRSIGPYEGEFNVGGRCMLIGTTEVKFPLAENIYWLFFGETGDAWPSFSEANFRNFKRGAGAGIRIEIPMLGIMGFDYGYRFDSVPEHQRGQWEPHFQLGTTF
jgi:outer membrane protein insertion porin family